MKRIVLLLLTCVNVVYAERSIGDAKRFFQASVVNYQKNPTADNAQLVVDEYDSAQNTDKYRRTFDAFVTAKKLNMADIRQKAATLGAPAKGLTSSGDQAQDVQMFMTFAVQNGIENELQTAELINKYRLKRASFIEVAEELGRIAEENSGVLALAPSAEEEMPVIPAADENLKTVLEDAQANWRSWPEAQKKDLIARLQQEDERAKALYANLQKDSSTVTVPLKKSIDALRKSLEKNLAAAKTSLANKTEATFTTMNQQYEAVQKDLMTSFRMIKEKADEIQTNWANWTEQQRKAAIANTTALQAYLGTIPDGIAQYLDTTNIRKAADDAGKYIADTFAAAKKGIVDVLPQGYLTETELQKQEAAKTARQERIQANAELMGGIGFDGMPDVDKNQLAKLDTEVANVLDETDPKTIEDSVTAKADLINALDEETPADPDDAQVTEAQNAVDIAVDANQKAQEDVDALEIEVLEQYGYLNAIDAAARDVTQAVDSIGVAGTMAIAATAATGISVTLTAIGELFPELKDAANKFKGQLNSLTQEIGAQLVLFLQKASEKIQPIISQKTFELSNKLIAFDKTAQDLLKAESELEKKIAKNQKKAYQILSEGLDKKIGEVKLELKSVTSNINNIDKNIESIKKRAAKSNIGAVTMKADVKAYYDKLTSTKARLEFRVKELETVKNKLADRLRTGIAEIDAKVEKYIKKNEALNKLSADRYLERERIRSALRHDKPLMAAAAVDEAMAKLSDKAKQLAESFAESAVEFKQGAKVTLNSVRMGLGNLSAMPQATIKNIAPVIKDYMVAIRQNIQQAGATEAQNLAQQLKNFLTPDVGTDIKSIRAPKNFTVPTNISQALTKSQQAIVDNARGGIEAAQTKFAQAKEVVKQRAKAASDILKSGMSKDAQTIRQAVQDTKQAAADLKASATELAEKNKQFVSEKLANAAESLRSSQMSQRAAKAAGDLVKLLQRTVK